MGGKISGGMHMKCRPSRKKYTEYYSYGDLETQCRYSIDLIGLLPPPITTSNYWLNLLTGDTSLEKVEAYYPELAKVEPVSTLPQGDQGIRDALWPCKLSFRLHEP
jgi:hypothetical protein